MAHSWPLLAQALDHGEGGHTSNLRSPGHPPRPARSRGVGVGRGLRSAPHLLVHTGPRRARAPPTPAQRPGLGSDIGPRQPEAREAPGRPSLRAHATRGSSEAAEATESTGGWLREGGRFRQAAHHQIGAQAPGQGLGQGEGGTLLIGDKSRGDHQLTQDVPLTGSRSHTSY